jgi:hypothetical protein
MDKTIDQIMQQILLMSKEERKQVLDVIKFLAWKRKGGRKTAAVSRGQRLYYWILAHKDTLTVSPT